MSIPRNIKRFWMWVGVALLIELAAITLWKRWYWFFPSSEVSELYTRYAGTEGLNVVFVKDFRIGDNIVVDVTLLESQTDSVWSMLQRDFSLAPPPLDTLHPSDSNAVDFWYAPHENHSLPMDSVLLNNDIVVVSYHKRTVAVFDIEPESQIDAILNFQITNTNKQYKSNEQDYPCSGTAGSAGGDGNKLSERDPSSP